MKENQKMSLMNWIWRSFLRIALIPLIAVELAFIGIYFFSNDWANDVMMKLFKDEAQEDLLHMVSRESKVITMQLDSIAKTTNLYRKEVEQSIMEGATFSEKDQNRLRYSDEGVFHTTHNIKEGGAAVFYSGAKTQDHNLQKLARILTTQGLMKHIYKTESYATAVYFNSHDSLNVIYPYIDVMNQFNPQTIIPRFNFYYEADQEHNPDRKTKWTDVYLDPAGNGWMASSISPVYKGDFLEGVVGIDVTLDTITSRILDLDMPWDGFGMLVGKDGTILALPQKGEVVLGIDELNEYDYEEQIYTNTFKPGKFNLYNQDETQHFADILSEAKQGLTMAKFNGKEHFLAWSTIDETGWKFISVVDEDSIFQELFVLDRKLMKIGALMIFGLILFYLMFFLFLYRRAQKLTYSISNPLYDINKLVQEIGAGRYYQNDESFRIEELDETATSITSMGKTLGSANEELYKAQEKIKAKESDLRALVSSIDDVIMILDENGKYINIWTNDESKLSRPKDELLDDTIESVFPEKDALFFMATIRDVQETGQPKTVEYEIDTLADKRWFQGRLAPIVEESGEYQHFVLTARDITDLKELQESLRRAKEEAEQANKAKSDFLSSMSHELRTPMNAILGFTQLLDYDKHSLTQSQRENIEEILKAGNHLLTLINEILDLARIEAGKLTVSIESVEIYPVLEEVLGIINPLASKRDITIDHNLDSCEGLYVYADRTRLKQVLLNLMSNAVKYNQDQGEIRIKCTIKNSKAQFLVEDTGLGIDDKEIDQIFEPFTRILDEKIVEGTGIGLTLSKQLVALMNGTISVKSELGAGSKFWVELPSVETINTEPVYEVDSELHVPLQQDQKKKVLYIEDNLANLHLVQKMIAHDSQIEMISAMNGEIGLKLVKTHQPDIVLVDLNLPGMDGYEILSVLKNDDSTKDIPVIAVSANAIPQEIEKGIAVGFNNYLTNPIDVTALLRLLQKLLYEK